MIKTNKACGIRKESLLAQDFTNTIQQSGLVTVFRWKTQVYSVQSCEIYLFWIVGLRAEFSIISRSVSNPDPTTFLLSSANDLSALSIPELLKIPFPSLSSFLKPFFHFSDPNHQYPPVLPMMFNVRPENKAQRILRAVERARTQFAKARYRRCEGISFLPPYQYLAFPICRASYRIPPVAYRQFPRPHQCPFASFFLGFPVTLWMQNVV